LGGGGLHQTEKRKGLGWAKKGRAFAAESRGKYRPIKKHAFQLPPCRERRNPNTMGGSGPGLPEREKKEKNKRNLGTPLQAPSYPEGTQSMALVEKVESGVSEEKKILNHVTRKGVRRAISGKKV